MLDQIHSTHAQLKPFLIISSELLMCQRVIRSEPAPDNKKSAVCVPGVANTTIIVCASIAK